MLTWQDFLKIREHQLHEPKNHKDAVKEAKKVKLEFFEKRKQGAAKIAAEARSKGGPSMLTAWHFAAKAQPYNDVLSAIRTDKDENFFMQKCLLLATKLKFAKLDEEQFQKLMGQIEVWGEAFAKLWH
jgi:hypothetical protein